MTPETILTGVLALLGSGGAASLVSWLVARGRLPVERTTAHAAASSEIAAAASALLGPLREEVSRLGESVQDAHERAEAAEQTAASAAADAREARAQSAATEREAALLRDRVTESDAYIIDLHARWSEHRARDTPPFWRWLTGQRPPTD